MPPPSWTSSEQDDREERRGRDRSRDLRQRLGDAREPGLEPMATPTGMVHSGGQQQREVHAQKGRARALEEFKILRAGHRPHQQHRALCRDRTQTPQAATSSQQDDAPGEISLLRRMLGQLRETLLPAVAPSAM